MGIDGTVYHPLEVPQLIEECFETILDTAAELNRIELLRDVFVWAYERSSPRHSAVRQSLGEPDPFRLRHRALVVELVAAVVRAGMDRRAATALARQHAAERVPPVDRARFVEVVETEIMSLHEGNIARYRLRPAEYQACRQGWRWM